MNSLILNGEGERRFLVNTHTCPKMTDSLEQQAYDKNGQPDKSSGLDHMCFTGKTKVQTPEGLIEFKDLPESGFVLGPYGEYVKYENAGKTGSKQTVKITIAGGYVIECTHDHLFLTENGEWIQASQLSGKSCVLSIQSAKSSLGLNTTYAANTFSDHKTRLSADCIELSGCTSTERFRMDSTSITKTTIAVIMKSKTSNSLASRIMDTIMGWMRIKESAWLKLRESTGTSLSNGMGRLKALSGTKSTTSDMVTPCTQKSPACAAAAEKSLWQKSVSSHVQTFTAQDTARQKRDMRAELTMLLNSAKNADQTSLQISTSRVLTVQNATQSESVDVYCLTVPEYGCFKLTADSPIVSNCDAMGYPLAYLFPIKRKSQGMRKISGL